MLKYDENVVGVGDVEQGIPIPDRSKNLSVAQKRVLELGIGDSFHLCVPEQFTDPSGRKYSYCYQPTVDYIVNQLRAWSRKEGLKLAIRSLENTEAVRIWRVE